MVEIDRARFHFSATVHTTRREVLYALRALSMASQRTISNKIPWSGVTDKSWVRRHNQATFFFSSDEYRIQFVEWAKELLPNETWSYVGPSDEISAPDDDGDEECIAL
jgi:hypothetical protein